MFAYPMSGNDIPAALIVILVIIYYYLHIEGYHWEIRVLLYLALPRYGDCQSLCLSSYCQPVVSFQCPFRMSYSAKPLETRKLRELLRKNLAFGLFWAMQCPPVTRICALLFQMVCFPCFSKTVYYLLSPYGKVYIDVSSINHLYEFSAQTQWI